jgi:hypothetical protein
MKADLVSKNTNTLFNGFCICFCGYFEERARYSSSRASSSSSSMPYAASQASNMKNRLVSIRVVVFLFVLHFMVFVLVLGVLRFFVIYGAAA